MIVQFKPVHAESKHHQMVPSVAIEMRLPSDKYDDPIDLKKNYPCVVLTQSDGKLAVRKLISDIIVDHGKPMTHQVNDGENWTITVWRVA